MEKMGRGEKFERDIAKLLDYFGIELLDVGKEVTGTDKTTEIDGFCDLKESLLYSPHKPHRGKIILEATTSKSKDTREIIGKLKLLKESPITYNFSWDDISSILFVRDSRMSIDKKRSLSQEIQTEFKIRPFFWDYPRLFMYSIKIGIFEKMKRGFSDVMPEFVNESDNFVSCLFGVNLDKKIGKICIFHDNDENNMNVNNIRNIIEKIKETISNDLDIVLELHSVKGFVPGLKEYLIELGLKRIRLIDHLTSPWIYNFQG